MWRRDGGEVIEHEIDEARLAELLRMLALPTRTFGIPENAMGPEPSAGRVLEERETRAASGIGAPD